MVYRLNQAMSLTGSGLRDWLIQRISSLVLAFYTLFILIYFFLHPHLSYITWHNLFCNTSVRVMSALALLALILHAWVGIWTIITDYLKATWLRFTAETALILALLAYFLWGLDILWRVCR